MSSINHNIKDTTNSLLPDLEEQQIEIELNNNTDTMNADNITNNSNNINNNDNSLTDNNTLTNSNNSKLDDKNLRKKLHEEDENINDEEDDDERDDSSIDSALHDNSLRQQLENNDVYRERVRDYEIIPEGEIQLSSKRESDYDYSIKISPPTNKEDETNLFNKTYTNTNYYNIITKPNLSRTLSSPASGISTSRKSSIINANINSNNNNSLLSGSAILNTSPAVAAAVSSARSRANTFNTLNNSNSNLRNRDNSIISNNSGYNNINNNNSNRINYQNQNLLRFPQSNSTTRLINNDEPQANTEYSERVRNLSFVHHARNLTYHPNDSIKLLTLNCWGLKYISKHRKERLHAIAHRLASSDQKDDYDVVALQEIWVSEDWEYIEKVCAKKYPHRRIFSSGIITGPGLAILSKIPIRSTFLYKYPINGRPSAFYRGDWYVGKSLAVTLLEPNYDNASPIALLNSHMHAPYSLTGDAAYSCHRACQAWDIASLATSFSEAGYAVILTGDLNSRPGSLPYNILQYESCLKDSWEVLNGPSDLEAIKKMSPEDQIKKGATTCDSILNTWRATRRPDEACRLDYCLIDYSKLIPIDASVEFTEQIPNIGSYSDHFAYTATFRILPISHHGERMEFIEQRVKVYQDLKDIVEEYIENTIPFQRKWRLYHFYFSMFIFISFLPIIVVVSYRAPWASILFYLSGVLITVSGVINGLIVLLFGKSEKRALNEILYQVEDKTQHLKNYKFTK
ncbi:hypothetical protein B5S28_g451 [[Candida] boidinii]|nr:hypothetical protein B5S28_g451 [[Candida] boidinii]OWB60236.1 hypothetical protein B5S29_g1107 [[Candida] boidinii]OWB71123.1 hypothetical protein B5S31_g807 [[Candida] boidinii]OWB77389.1 hypothetical protein B5S32_g1553 [[Candida] boidinii]